MPNAALFIACLTLVIKACAQEQSVPEMTAEMYVTEGDAHLKASKFDDALKSFSSAIKLDTTNYNSYYKRAGIYLLRGKNKNGLDDLNKVLELNPTFLQARLRRAKVRMVLGDFLQSEEDLRTVLQTKPDNELALKHLADLEKCTRDMEHARTALENNKNDDALRLLGQVLEISSDNKEARILRAKVNLNAKDYRVVLEDTMSILKQQSGNVEALFLRGRAFYQLGEREGAIKHYREGLKFDPEHSQCKSEFKRLSKLEKLQKSGTQYLEENKPKEALEEFDTAISLEPDNVHFSPSLYLSKCRAHLELKEGDKAIVACTEALKLDENLVEALIKRAEAYMLAEDWEKAIHEYNKAREKQPQNQAVNEGLHRAQKAQKMAQRKDYYKILGVGRDATDSEIKKAYRKGALLWHPDKHPEDKKEEAGKKYVELCEAYDLLSDPEARGKYDRGEDLNVQPNFHPGQGFPFGGQGFGGPFHFSFNFGG